MSEYHKNKIDGVLTCLDRIVIGGTLQGTSYPEGMSLFINALGVRVFDYPAFANTLRLQLRRHIEERATSAGIKIDYRRKWRTDKLEEARRMSEKRGKPLGLICVFGAAEKCICFKPWRDKERNTCYLKWDRSQCTHYYLYFNDAELCCPVHKEISAGYYWTIKQLECATDIVFKDDAYLQAIYPDLLKSIMATVRGEINIGGFRNKDLRKHLVDKTAGQVSRLLKRMRLHGIIKKAARGYKYYLTDTAREVVITILKIKEMLIIPSLC